MWRTEGRRLSSIVALAFLLSTPLGAFTRKEPRYALDDLVVVRPEQRAPQTPVEMEDLRPGQSGTGGLRTFRAEHGTAWSATLDARRNVVTLLHGGSIPLFPGNGNALRWEEFDPSCRSATCLPTGAVERSTRRFLERYQALLGIDPGELVLDPATAGPVEHMRFPTYRQVVKGVPVEGAALRFHVNRGNLIQVSTTRLAPVAVDPIPTLEPSDAVAVLAAYLGGFPDPADRIFEQGSLLLVPISPLGSDPDRFAGPTGTGIAHALVYRIAFERPGVTGRWEALVDAHRGDILRFVDTNRYGRVHGGVYPGDGHTGAADRPLPFVQTSLAPPNDYADVGGRFPGDAATVNLRYGKYTWVNDACGSNALTTADGDADYAGWPDPVGTDCAVPSPNPGDPGNTMSSRTQYYHLTMVNIKARTYYPSNSWLHTSHMNVNVNQSPWCNATSGGGTLNFYQAAAGCWNLGELPGVSIHEWGHSWDDYDESGGSSPPVETRADWTATLQIHDSCTGRGFYHPSGNCSGYGDTCLNCSGIRDSDYWMHANKTPWTPSNHGSFWSCSGGSYFGPCGLEDHCESGISTQALWEMVKGPRTPPEPDGDFYALCGLDAPTGWQLMDRLFWTSHSALDAMYNCTLPDSSGCTGDTLYNLFMAIDDDGDGTANGTPHAAAIFAALDRHKIACGSAEDARNKNHASPACVPLARPQNLAALGQNNRIVLEWGAVAGASRYDVFRNETDCAAGYTRVAEVAAPATTYTDDEVVNGIPYHYRVQPYFEDAPACTGTWGPMSECVTSTPVPCQMPGTPTGLVASPAGDNRIALTWSNGDPASTAFHVYRALGVCPQTGYVRIASGLLDTAYVDEPVSGQIPYAYVVSGLDETGLCETAYGNCDDAETTGSCTQAPAFAGVQSVADPASGVCSLDLAWSAGSAHCGGPLQYRIYRSATPGFVPGPENLLATVSSTTFRDMNALVTGALYHYVVRAVDAANGVEETNRVERSGRPSGPPVLGTWTDDAGDSGDAKMVPASNCGGPVSWTVSHLTNHTPGGSRAYRSVLPLDADNPSGAVPDNNCSALLSPPLETATGPEISFWTQYDLEANWDGVVLETRICGDPLCTTGIWQPVTNAELVPDYPSTLSASQTGDCSGAKVCGDVYPYPNGDGAEWINDCDYPSTMEAFTGSSSLWTRYTATLAPAYDGVTMQFRFNLTTDCAARNPGAYVDDLKVTNVMVPGSCATGSSCPDNPFVDVTPDGPLALCPGTAQGLTAGLTGGTAPFTYQWKIDGTPIPGATSAEYAVADSGAHTYNCDVRGSGCPDSVFDPAGVAIAWQGSPSFAGLASVSNPMGSTCTLELSWPGATTPCPGGVTYSVYRSTSSPVPIAPPNRIASGLLSTSYTDAEGLSSGTTYHYVVRAVSAFTGEEDANVVERSGAPTGATAVVFSDSFESGNLGWTFAKGTPAALTGDFLIGDPVGTTGNNGQRCQPEDDHTAEGVACLYTAANPAGSAGADDVDEGEVVATSPVVDLSGYSAATLDLWRWFENEDVEDAGDYYVLEASDDGSSWVELERIPDTVTTANAWTHVAFDLVPSLDPTPTTRIRVRVADGTAAGDLVELAVDDVSITGHQVCTTGASGPPPVADGAGGTQPMRLSKGSGDQIHVTVDDTACRDDHLVVLAGTLGDFSGYQWAPDGCAFAAGGAGSGTITEPNSDVWFLALWVTGSGVAGHPGDASSEPRSWSAAGLCSVTADDPRDLACDGGGGSTPP